MAASVSVQFDLADGVTVTVEGDDLRRVYELLWTLTDLPGAVSTTALLIHEADRHPPLPPTGRPKQDAERSISSRFRNRPPFDGLGDLLDVLPVGGRHRHRPARGPPRRGATIATFQHVWELMVGGSLGSALAALGLGRVHARHVQSVDDVANDALEALADPVPRPGSPVTASAD